MADRSWISTFVPVLAVLIFPAMTGNIVESVKTSTDSKAMHGGANKAGIKPKAAIVNANDRA